MIGREIISQNFWWKLLALFLATLVWLTFHSGGLRFHFPDSFGSIIGNHAWSRVKPCGRTREGSPAWGAGNGSRGNPIAR